MNINRHTSLLFTLITALTLYACFKHNNSLTNETVTYYNHTAKSWQFLSNGKPLLEAIATYAPAKTHKTVIDIGCGPGMHAKRLTDEGRTVLCVDPAKKMLDKCKEKGLRTHHSSWQNFKPTDERFDLALALHSFIHIDSNAWSASIKKVAHILNPGGIFIIGFFEGNKPYIGRTKFRGLTEDGPRFTVYRYDITAEAFEKMLPPNLEIVHKRYKENKSRSKTNPPSYIYVLKKRPASLQLLYALTA